ncbi:hypothetical protein GIB67_037612, partial [Kingdonia uniflora]
MMKENWVSYTRFLILTKMLQSKDLLQVIRRSDLTTIYRYTAFNARCFPGQSSTQENHKS